jgi:CubicO group peptidase (beta-lactamase class C family)
MTIFDGFDDFMATIMQKWHVPGMAVAVVQDDAVIYQQGFGLRDVEQNLPVTPETVFAIGSSTKAFSAMALGILVDDGVLDWHKPIRHYMPDFELMDKFATERMTAIDLVTHRSGLPRHDLMWYNASRSRKEIIDRLKHLEPSKDFRTFMQYQNLMYMTAGYLVEVITGKTWEAFVQERIFEPLMMTSTNTSVADTQKGDNYALPYSKEEGKDRRPIPFRNIDTVGPAGSINSNAVDMANWLRLNLNNGKFGDKQIVSEDIITELQSKQMPLVKQAMMFPVLDNHPEVGQASYGMGWFIQNYRGTKWVHHGGAIDGFIAQVMMLPQKNMGVVCLSNLGGKHVPIAVGCNIFDRLLEKEPIDWDTMLEEFTNKMMGQIGEINKKLEDSRHPNTQPSHADLSAYTGEYEHPGYGIFTVALEDNALKACYNGLEFAAEHLHYDVFALTREALPVKMPISFITGIDGNIAELRVQLEPAVKPLTFTRIPTEAEKSEEQETEKVEA